MSSGLVRAFVGGLALVASVSASQAVAAPRGAHSKTSSAHGAQSIGAPNSGKLVGAVRLRGSRTLKQREGRHSWGLPELVRLLHHAGSAVARQYRGSQMLVGDLSGRTGGPIEGHGSHQSGRDADVGFYVMNSKGKPIAAKRFIPFDDAGLARDANGVHFDEARNWAMVEAMLKDERASVRYIFISNALRGKLLAHAAKKHAPREIVERAASVMMSPRDAEPHDDHMHVRISCPEASRAVCAEEATAPQPKGVSGASVKEEGAAASDSALVESSR